MSAGRDGVDLTPVLSPDPHDLRVSLSTIVHWADSHAVRMELMRAVEFGFEDLPMFLVVNQLAYRGAMRPTDLAHALGTGKANLSKIARRLVAAGLVSRVRSETDERSVLLALTPAGRAVGERIMEQTGRALQATLADWSASDLRTLRTYLARLAQAATRYASPARHD